MNEGRFAIRASRPFVIDIARVLLLDFLYAAGMALGFANSFLYGGGLVGYFPLLVAFFAGPWLAAWVSCKVLPSEIPRMVLRLSLGLFAGFCVWWLTLGVVSRFLPDSSILALLPLAALLVVGPLAFSRIHPRGGRNGIL